MKCMVSCTQNSLSGDGHLNIAQSFSGSEWSRDIVSQDISKRQRCRFWCLFCFPISVNQGVHGRVFRGWSSAGHPVVAPRKQLTEGYRVAVVMCTVHNFHNMCIIFISCADAGNLIIFCCLGRRSLPCLHRRPLVGRVNGVETGWEMLIG